jgi:hypothetical protein
MTDSHDRETSIVIEQLVVRTELLAAIKELRSLPLRGKHEGRLVMLRDRSTRISGWSSTA